MSRFSYSNHCGICLVCYWPRMIILAASYAKPIINSTKLSPTTNVTLSGYLTILPKNLCFLFVTSVVVCIVVFNVNCISCDGILLLLNRHLNNSSDSAHFHFYFNLHKHVEHSPADSPWLLSMFTEQQRDWPCCHINVAPFPWHVSRFPNVHSDSVLQIISSFCQCFCNFLC